MSATALAAPATAVRRVILNWSWSSGMEPSCLAPLGSLRSPVEPPLGSEFDRIRRREVRMRVGLIAPKDKGAASAKACEHGSSIGLRLGSFQGGPACPSTGRPPGQIADGELTASTERMEDHPGYVQPLEGGPRSTA